MFIEPVMQAVLYQGGMNLWSSGFWENLGDSIHGWLDDDDRRRDTARILPECPSIDTSSPFVYNNECLFRAPRGVDFLVARDLEFAAPDAVTVIVSPTFETHKQMENGESDCISNRSKIMSSVRMHVQMLQARVAWDSSSAQKLEGTRPIVSSSLEGRHSWYWKRCRSKLLVLLFQRC